MGQETGIRTGWGTRLARLSMALLVFEGISGLAITLAPFHATIEWNVIVHTLAGVLSLLPIAWYAAIHWDDYRSYSMSHVVFLGYVAIVALLICSVSGLVVTWQGLFGVRMSGLWRNVHLFSGPVVGLFSGALILGESIGPAEIVALILVVGALAAAHQPWRSTRPPDR